MSRGKLALTIVAGLLVFLAVLVFYLPAAWLGSYLPPQVRCAELGGSIWHGECLGLEVQQNALGDATWNFTPMRAFAGRLVGDVTVRGPMIDARADLDTDFRGVGELRNVTARFPLDPAFVPQMPRDQRASIQADLPRLAVGEGGTVRAVQGVVELRELRQVGVRPLDLGSYEVRFDGAPGGDGQPVVGTLRDLGGPFTLKGTLTLTPPNMYVVRGAIQGKSADAERLVREITFGVPPDASGFSQLSFEGSY
jgi:hypothetical protein